MAGPLRRAGRLADEAGGITTWSVAEGRRGRRWRWSAVDRRGSLVAAHTLELDPEGRFAGLESAAAAGLLTLHREADGSLHGNRVGGRGVDHIEVPAPAPGLVLVGAGPVGPAAVAAALVAAAGGPPIDGLEVLDDLGVRVVGWSVHRVDGTTLELVAGRVARRVALDALAPRGGEGSPTTSWPLERD